jgi:hypothetical protein
MPRCNIRYPAVPVFLVGSVPASLANAIRRRGTPLFPGVETPVQTVSRAAGARRELYQKAAPSRHLKRPPPSKTPGGSWPLGLWREVNLWRLPARPRMLWNSQAILSNAGLVQIMSQLPLAFGPGRSIRPFHVQGQLGDVGAHLLKHL